MDQRRTFLDTLRSVVNKWIKDGIVDEEQLQNKIYIPLDWLYTSGIYRKTLNNTMERICSKTNKMYDSKYKNSKQIPNISILKRDDEILLEVQGRDDWTFFRLSDNDKYQGDKIAYYTSDDFIKEMYKTKMLDIKSLLEEKAAKTGVKNDAIFEILFNKYQVQNELNGLSVSLDDMVKNLDSYYRYLMEEKNNVESIKSQEDEQEIIKGGIIDRDVDERPEQTRKGNSKTERKSEIYQYQERDKIFRDLKPMKIISFDSLGEDNEVIPGSYTSYVFKNPRENKGYFLILEPLEGTKATRGVYIQGENEADNEYWTNLAREYLEMSGNVFNECDNTYTFRHTSIQNFADRIRCILTDEVSDEISYPIRYNSRIIVQHLFGYTIKQKGLQKISEEAEIGEIEGAKEVIMGNIKGERQEQQEEQGV